MNGSKSPPTGEPTSDFDKAAVDPLGGDTASASLSATEARFVPLAAVFRLDGSMPPDKHKIPLMIEEIRRARSELATICLRHNVRKLDLFGSAIGSGFDSATSDLDFLVEFGPFPQGGYSEHYFGLIEDLTALCGRPVDLLVARAVRNPYLLESINQTHESLYTVA